ncbi:hypothetical protein BGW36DRAFT_466256 [Talaromyces proteolyticus]|uniref:GPI anchored protein n=1 Tax=Talaromyces proteolyticus TaxID=1131652 RepID=A0AAD4KEQ0_9EURO|nr:uncharacterized protein BGW36DRAFT_466256 [Talaromyces proteolyticus]KAH8689352.1 hypothetical protein BGW36DRAFT_466256 [Talaromyces proteolyticus]
MHVTFATFALYMSISFAQWNGMVIERRHLAIGRTLEARQDFNCTMESTCSECYGPGNVLCSDAGCFDPSQSQQCCADGSYCVAANNSCCGSVGGGVTGTDGAVATTAYNAYFSSLTASTNTAVPCLPTDTNEECCQKVGTYIKWCAGDWPNQSCYNPNSQTCCSDGVVCSGQNCCSLVSAVATTPNPTQATAPPSSSISSIAASTIFTPSTTATATATAASSTHTGGANSMDSTLKGSICIAIAAILATVAL